MTSIKATSRKRATLPRASDRTKAFVKDWTKLMHSGRYDLTRLKEAMILLVANDKPRPPEWSDHPLSGEWADHRECHIGGNFLLIYRLDGSGTNEVVLFVRAGTHAELFVNAVLSRLNLGYQRWPLLWTGVCKDVLGKTTVNNIARLRRRPIPRCQNSESAVSGFKRRFGACFRTTANCSGVRGG